MRIKSITTAVVLVEENNLNVGTTPVES